MINKDQTKELQKKLEAEEERLVKELSSFADRKAKGDFETRYQDFGDSEDDNIEEYRQHDFNLSLEKKFEGELEKVRNALKKIAKGKYGVCDKCGGKINPKRLDAYPAAAHCMKCHAEES